MTDKTADFKRLLLNMASLVELGQEVTSAKNMTDRMRSALYIVSGTFSVPTAALFIYVQQRRRLEMVAHKGHRDAFSNEPTLTVRTSDLNAFQPNEPHTLREMTETEFFNTNRTVLSRLQSRLFLPLFAKDEFVGAIVLGKKLGRASFRRSDRELLRVIAHHMAISLHNSQLFLELTRKAAENKRLYQSMRRIYHDTIQAFSAAIDAKDEYTKDHSYRVACYAVAIARELGWKKKDVEGIYVAGLLHDIGKIIIDTRLIKKGERLTSVEIDQIKKHPQISYSILSKIKFPWKNIEHFVRHHHERPDGKGYPDSLMAADLSEGEKILALADAFDAMTTDRPYRAKMGIEEAFQEVTRCIGTQFDQRITDTFFALLQKEMKGDVTELQLLPLLRNDWPEGKAIRPMMSA
jgi:putative nucleotidyltransferase with HDIG domain